MLVVASVLATAGAVVGLPAAHADEAGPAKVLFLLDVSGSMNERISSGGTKFAAAKKALKEVAGSLPAGTDVGLRVYGSEIAEPKSQNPKACTDSQLVLPIGPLDQGRMNRAVDSFQAKGETPIAYSLGKAVDDLGDSGRRILVLISDGQETCAKDPCPTARKLASSGIDLQFNAIGLAVGGRARQQLQCVADAGNGSYYDASRSSELSEAIRTITRRALRPFQFDGTAVRATASTDGAPTIGVGRWTDVYDARGTSRYYQVARTPGSAVTASVASIVNPYPAQNRDSWTLKLAAPDGASCGSYLASSSTYHGITVVSGAVSSDGATGAGAPAAATCRDAPTLLLSLSRTSAFASRSKSNPVEIQVSEEPTVTNLAALPGPLKSYDGAGPKIALARSSAPVLAGTSFSGAEALEPGSYTDSLATGETVFYKVRLQPGQRLRTSLYAPAPKSGWSMGVTDVVTAQLDLYAPSRLKLTRQTAQLQGDRKVTVTAATPQVRVRNRERPVPTSYVDTDTLAAASVAGDYYVAVGLDPLVRDFAGRVMSIRLEVAVDGQPTGLPEYAAAATPTPSASSTPSSAPPSPLPSSAAAPPEDDGTQVSLTAAVGIGLAVAVAVVGGALGLVRRGRRRS